MEHQEFIGQTDHLMIVTESLGQGSQDLGKQLMKAYLYTLARSEHKLKRISFLNSGVKLSCEGSEVLEDLKLLEQQGVKIHSCGTCLNFYGLTEKIQIGVIGNMQSIVDAQMQSNTVVLG